MKSGVDTTAAPAPLVSVIIPTYNRPDYLRSAIASVLQQSFQNIEIIVSDDGSASDPRPLVEAFQDERIRYRRSASNLGVAWNVTHALKMAQGKYIALLNDDDIWRKQFLETLVAPLEENDQLVVAFCDYGVIDADGTPNPERTEQQTRKEKRDRLQTGVYQPFWEIGLVDQAVFVASATVIRKSVINEDELPGAGVFWDYYLAYQACRSGGGAWYTAERLAEYRVHPLSENMQSGSQNAQAKIRKGKAGIACYARFAADSPTPELKAHFEREWAHANTTLAIGLMRDRQFTDARPYLRRSLQVSPFKLRTLLALLLSYIPEPVAHSLVHFRDPGVLSRAR
jgi:glycosyltransferase involved in cell wall biosynthesis